MSIFLIVLVSLVAYISIGFRSARFLVWHRVQQAGLTPFFEGVMEAFVWPVTLPWAIFYHHCVRMPFKRKQAKDRYLTPAQAFMRGPKDRAAEREAKAARKAERNDLKALEKRSDALEKTTEAMQRELDKLLDS